MKKGTVLIVLLIVAAAYYFTMMRSSGFTVKLSEQNNSGVSGKATLKEVDGKVQVTIAVKGEPASASQPAHIHMGACPTPGAVVHPLTNVISNGSVTTLNTTLAELKTKLPLAINLHKSSAESKVYTACGNLSF